MGTFKKSTQKGYDKSELEIEQAVNRQWLAKDFVGEDWIPIKREFDRLRKEIRALERENQELKYRLSAESEPQSSPKQGEAKD